MNATLDPGPRTSSIVAAAGGDRPARRRYWDLLDAADVALDIAPATPAEVREWARFEDYVERVLSEGTRD
jgi:hypothetical protein